MIKQIFPEDGAKGEEGSPCPTPSPETKARAKALKAKKAALKGVHSHKKKRRSARQPKYPGKRPPRRNQLDHYATIKLPLTAESDMKIEDNNTLVFIIDVKFNKAPGQTGCEEAL
ncbi:Hypothetical predicted protein [Lynx pardinus]|uniref:Uncharacterized protein n=1 Tax=Lynx pardinus TaxID=191816 RepID=A0A485NU56_LYNPA|nr:Hypothetical predicted protein [Lynx pardinus]